MKNNLSDRVLNLTESATLKMAALGTKLKEEGVDIISLSLGEPDFTTPKDIIEAAYTALKDGYTKYTPVPGLPQLRQAISNKFKRENNLDYGINQIVVSNGAKQSFANICMVLLNPGDEGIIFAPYWVSYYDIIRLNEGIPVSVEAGIENDYKVTAEQVEAAITDKTKFILFSSPCNPTGSVYTKEELKSIADMLEKYPDIYVISDEIYEYINYTPKHASIGSFPNMKDRTITINGFSKGYAMTGWRLGYMGAPVDIAKACSKIQGQFTSGATAFGQMAGVYALNSGKESVAKMRESYLRRRNLAIELLSKIDGMKVNLPEGAFYIFPDISAFLGKEYRGRKIETSGDLSMFLLEEAHVATVPGEAFGAPTCLRLSYAASDEEIIEAIKRIEIALDILK